MDPMLITSSVYQEILKGEAYMITDRLKFRLFLILMEF